jgi:hypothetical protein
MYVPGGHFVEDALAWTCLWIRERWGCMVSLRVIKECAASCGGIPGSVP